MNVVSINGKGQADLKRKQDMLEVLEGMRTQIESGDITEFVATSLGSDGLAQIHICALDIPGSVGLFEIGKHILMTQEA